MATWRLDGEVLPASTPIDAVREGDRLLLRGGATAIAARIGSDLHVSYGGRTFVLSDRAPSRTKAGEVSTGDLRAPMPGSIVEVLTTQGSTVQKGQRLVVMEAMKTQQILAAPFDGTVSALDATAGAQVTEGQVLVRVEPNGESTPEANGA